MVRKYDRHGNPYHEPPYTAAEEMELYRSMSGVVAYTRVVKAEPAVSDKPEAAKIELAILCGNPSGGGI